MILTITKLAEEDLSEIAFYTYVTFGERQMEIYRSQFKKDFQRILSNPLIGVKKKELGTNIYSLVSGSHVIFYSIVENTIQIIRIIHGSKDIPNEFMG